jgi:hypothetical protein
MKPNGSCVGVDHGSALTNSVEQLAAAGPVNPHAQILVRTGVDPAMTPSANAAKVASSEDRTHNTRIQIVWSNKCYAGWARIARYDGLAEGNAVKISIYLRRHRTDPIGKTLRSQVFKGHTRRGSSAPHRRRGCARSAASPSGARRSASAIRFAARRSGRNRPGRLPQGLRLTARKCAPPKA